jgi:Protein of unknown function (DUF1351)
MNELSVIIQQGKVEVLRFEELKQEVIAKVSHYKMLTIDETQLILAKTDLASLRKLAKALNDERIAKEKEYMAPFNNAKAQIDSLVAPVKEAIENIDSQLKAFEQREADKKTLDIIQLWESKHFNLLPYSKVYDARWLNKGFTLDDISTAMDKFIEKVNADFALIERLCGADNDEAITDTWAIYKESVTLDAVASVDEHERRIKAKKQADEERLQAKAKREAEQQARNVELPKTQLPPVEEEKPTPTPITTPLLTYVLEITGTKEQQIALKQFLVSSGMTFKKAQ